MSRIYIQYLSTKVNNNKSKIAIISHQHYFNKLAFYKIKHVNFREKFSPFFWYSLKTKCKKTLCFQKINIINNLFLIVPIFYSVLLLVTLIVILRAT